MNQPATIAMDWVPAFGPSTAVLDMETVLSCSLLIWLLARLLPRCDKLRLQLTD